MDKNAIKKYAVWARRELIERVSQRAMIYGITAKDAGDPSAESVNGHLLSQTEKRQRQALIRNIKEKGYEQVMEEVAYTWFNRFAALRFMEVNGYLPSHIRVFTNDEGEFKPQILAEAIHLELDGLDMNRVYELENANKSEELFKYLLIVQCNALNSILPGMFQRIDDYTELLLPDYLLREGSVIEQMVTTIPEEDWTDQVQIIGWLYQYYNTEPKDKVFADLKKNIKITKENIPAATQLFTPDWIVHYMVENSLGRLWLEGHPNDALKSEWKYYLDEAEQEPEVQAQLATIRKEYAALKPEEIRVIDPCMGSGHILCVLFDVLVRIYEDYGYTAREAAVKIVENNLWGLDIDERAAQLSYFAVMMKARQYDRRFFNRKVQPHVYAIEESNGITSAPMHDMGLNLSQEEYGEAVKQAMRLVEEMHDAKEYGSIIHVSPCDWDLLRRFAVPREEEGQLHLDIHGEIEASARLQQLINIGESLSQKYDVVVTNPPYMSMNNGSDKMVSFVKRNYLLGKSDLATAMMQCCDNMLKNQGLLGMITMHSWMFLASFEGIRDWVLSRCILSMLHLGAKSFEEISGEIVQTVSFVSTRNKCLGYRGKYIRLVKLPSQKAKELGFLNRENCFETDQNVFNNIPKKVFAYWASKEVIKAFTLGRSIGSIADVKVGLQTGANEKYVRNWTELDITTISFGNQLPKQWVPYNKGGGYWRWYGLNTTVVDWRDNGFSIKHEPGAILRNVSFYFKEGITWSGIASINGSFRYSEKGFLFDSNKGPMIFRNRTNLYPILGLLNSKVATSLIEMLNPSVSLQLGNVASIPMLSEAEDNQIITEIVKNNILISKEDWDSFETSWDFQLHPLVAFKSGAGYVNTPVESWIGTIQGAFYSWQADADARFAQLKTNEEELNRIFIDIYGLQDELTPDVEEKDVTVRRADLQRDIKSLISYAVGCMFGRYSLDVPGLAYAGGEWDASQYTTVRPDSDAIIPICDDEYFEDDIVGRFVKFVEVVYGKETLEDNLRFIADALGGKGSSREVIRNYFINDFWSSAITSSMISMQII